MIKFFISIFFTLVTSVIFAQQKQFLFLKANMVMGPDSIAPVGVIKNLTNDQLLETVQKQTFRFFWHGAHPHSGLALERSNTVKAEHYWDYINEAWDEPKF